MRFVGDSSRRDVVFRSFGALCVGALLSGAVFLAPVAGAGPNDPDDDGLTNASEELWGTDPANPDTDTDGLRDGDEIYGSNTDPKNDDTDGDGFSDNADIDPKDPKRPAPPVSAAPAAPPMEAPNPFRGVVLDDVDVYDVPGGSGNITGILRKGSFVFPRTPCPAADWCELTTSPPGQSVGWVWGEFLRNEPNG